MSGVRKQVDQIISVHIAPFLKEQGFKKTGRHWYRQNPESFFAINLQTSSWDSTRFTLNLGVHVPRLFSFFSEQTEIEKRKYYQCGFRERIGPLMPEQKDHWWEIDYGTSLKRIGEEIVASLRDYGLPWLEAHLTLESTADHLKNEVSVYSSASALCLGDRLEAEKRLRKLLEFLSTKDDRFKAAVENHKEWGQKHGLLQPGE